MEDVIERTKCTGCTCCINLCPKKAISININEEGFEYPIIDKTKCINCGLCKRKCPVLNKKNNKSLNDCYVAFAKDNKLTEEQKISLRNMQGELLGLGVKDKKKVLD